MFWKKCWNTLSNTLNSLDKFEEPVQLNLKGESSTTSTLGGIISLVIMGFLGYQAIAQTVGMFNHNSQQIVQMNEFQNDPEAVYLTRDSNFLMGITTRIGDTFYNMSDHSLISFKAFHYQQRLTEFGPQILSAGQILWAPCNRSNLAPPIYPETLYDTVHMDYAYCARGINYTNLMTGVCPDYIHNEYPDCITPPDLKLQGTIFSSTFEFIKIIVTLCNPADNATISGLKCSSTAYNETLAAGGIFVYVAFANNYIDSNNYTTPNQTFIDFVDWNLQPEQTRTADIFFDMETIEDYDSYLFTDKSNTRQFYSISPDKMREQQLTPRNYLLDVNLQRSKLNRHTTRTYVKLFDVFSNVGGLSGTLFLIGSILALGYARYKYLMVLSNELYDFEKHQQTISIRKVALAALEDLTLDKNSQPISPHISTIVPSSPTKNQSKINMKEYFDSLKTKKKLHFNEFTFIKGLIMRIFRKKLPNEQLAQKAKKKVVKDLDISKVIEKLKEIDKIKMLLMSPSQLEAFNFIKKPIIKLGNKNNKYTGGLPSLISQDNAPDSPTIKTETSNLSDIQQKSDPSKYEKLYMAYRQMKEDKNTENFKLNKKILSMIDEEIMNVFAQIDNQNRRNVSETQHFDHITQEIQDKSMNINIIDY